MTKSYSFYPGCALHASAREYDVSTLLVCRALGIEITELAKWTCCGASSAHSFDTWLGLALPALDLQEAEKAGRPLVIACAKCYSQLKMASHEMQNRETLDNVNHLTGGVLKNTTEVVHLLQVLNLDSPDFTGTVKRPLKDLKVACYYGCLLVRPKDVAGFDDLEDPQIMDDIVRKLGAESVDWGLKTECCGASLMVTNRDVVMNLSHRLLRQAKQKGADCVAVACPLCHSNLDCYQKDIEKVYHDGSSLPVLYITQLMGLALGFTPKEMLMDRHLTDPLPLLRSKGLA
ncbi:MAG: CoB--CoM heterodisulfide reductase iron-sulfur subunit B family protein [Dehalococcoidia bacterium]|nr:CoB--CoM heterodisulfide reductase iron-sulfur subunit B family protein [Dehalococcoidia bacterium]